MKKLLLIISIISLAFLLGLVSYKEKSAARRLQTSYVSVKPIDYKPVAFDSTAIPAFFASHPEVQNYRTDIESLYRKHQYNYIWFEKNRVNEVGNLLYNKLQNISDEGILEPVPYINNLNDLFLSTDANQAPTVDKELLLSALYFFYTDKVYTGIGANKMAEMNWYLPRKKQSYVNYLDSLITNPSLLHKDEKEVFGQYYRLRELLKKYHQIEKKEDWKLIAIDKKLKVIQPGDSSATIAQIRHRFFITGDLANDSGSGLYDPELESAIVNFKIQNDFAPDKAILPRHIAAMNISPSERIKTIMVNMERSRWMCNCISNQNQMIVINIPSYQLTYFRDGKKVLSSNVVVGKVMNKTVVFNADMKYIVFSPYWNVPSSILNNEILPAIERDGNYLRKNDMEWHDGKVRQRPGPKNSLGLIKFLFPNNNSIYLHDTPAKKLFIEERRAFSHGCIRVEKTVELANLILKDDKNWTPEKIEAAMNSGIEKWYTLKVPIPVYIGYFTAWVEEDGTVHFYDDVYERDKALASLLFIK